MVDTCRRSIAPECIRRPVAENWDTPTTCPAMRASSRSSNRKLLPTLYSWICDDWPRCVEFVLTLLINYSFHIKCQPERVPMFMHVCWRACKIVYAIFQLVRVLDWCLICKSLLPSWSCRQSNVEGSNRPRLRSSGCRFNLSLAPFLA